jgi:2-dehydro-3-deoxygluconokinase
MFLGRKLSEHVINRTPGLRSLGNSNPQPRHIGRLQCGENRAHAIMRAGSAALSQTQRPERQIHVVVDDQAAMPWQLEPLEEATHGRATAVHIRLRLCQHERVVHGHKAPGVVCELPCGCATARDLVEDQKADVVPCVCILGPGIPKADDQPRIMQLQACQGVRCRCAEDFSKPLPKQAEHASRMVVLAAVPVRSVGPETSFEGRRSGPTEGQEPDVVALGETMVLFLAQQPGLLREANTFSRHVAGAESNVAVGLCRLGCTSGFISRVGDDEFGRAIAFRLRGEGVDVSRLIVDEQAPTGVLFRDRREFGAVDVVYYRRGSAASRLSPSDLDGAYIAGARFLVLSGITPALSESCKETVFAAAELARAAGVTVVLDPNIRLKLWTIDRARAVLRDLAGHSDVVLPGLDEAQLLTGADDAIAAAKELHALGPRRVVVKLGARGSLAVDDDGIVEVEAMQIPRVVDPVGAGDAFAAGLLAGQLKGMDLAQSMALAARCGAFAMTVPADQEGLPRWEDVALAAWSGDVRR